MNSIAILLTCFNRREKTLNSLSAIFAAQEKSKYDFSLDVFLTDDNSQDGTSEAVMSNFPKVNILKGNGSLYWAGGMRKSWSEAIKKGFDGYLLLNDDTDVFDNVFDELLDTHKDTVKNYGQDGVYIGSTKDKETSKLSYGGAVFENRFMFKYKFLEPNGLPQSCELGNANIMLVGRDVVTKIGILSEGYLHGVADYDYTLKAIKKNIPVMITPSFCGFCVDDHGDDYSKFKDISFKERYEMLKHPLKLDFRSNFLLQLRHFPLRAPFVALSALVKLIVPSLYVNSSSSRRIVTDNQKTN